jgi:hypothetical protein
MPKGERRRGNGPKRRQGGRQRALGNDRPQAGKPAEAGSLKPNGLGKRSGVAVKRQAGNNDPVEAVRKRTIAAGERKAASKRRLHRKTRCHVPER